MQKQKGFILPIIMVVVVIVLLGVAGYFAYKQYSAPKPIACTMEAKVCPDGSAVGRTGPNCEFADCPAITGQTKEECEEKNDCECDFVMCDYIPTGKTVEEVCGKDFEKGWQCRQIKDETADWKTYTNNEGKFSLKYPSVWKLDDKSSREEPMKTVIFTGNEGTVQVDYGQGFGGMCQQGYEKIQIGGEQLDACHYIDNGSAGEGFEQWDISAKELGNNFGIGMFITANKPYFSNRIVVLKILSTFKFTK